MKTLNFKKFLLIFLLLEIFFSYTPAQAVKTIDGYDYSTAGISTEIQKYLCTPTPVNVSQTNITNGVLNSQGNFQQQAAYGNANSYDLYNCINKIYQFSIILAGVVGVFFIVIAGYVYMSAEGNDEAVTKAKDILVSTISSMVILMAGFILLKAINPDLIQFRSVQPPSIKISDLRKMETPIDIVFNNLNLTSQSFSTSETKGCKSQSGNLEGNYYKFSQCNGSWANIPYTTTGQICKESDGSASTIGTSGCGPTSLATVLKNFGKDVDPAKIASLVIQNNGRVCGVGTYSTTLDKIARDYGMKTTGLNNYAAALQRVKDGGVIIASMGPGIFTSGGHFIVIYGVGSDGKFLIADSGPRNITKASEQEISASFKSGILISTK